jgi:hypothetical protein
MDSYWLNQFRLRIDEFSSAMGKAGEAISVKVRIDTGCFHREHSPQAYTIIDAYGAGLSRSVPEFNFRIEEHETGPEILVWLKEGMGFAKTLIDLVVTIVKARAEGNKKGDHPSSPLEIIVRGFHKDGVYYEEKIIRISPDHPLAESAIKEALNKQLGTKKPSKSKKTKKSPKRT